MSDFDALLAISGTALVVAGLILFIAEKIIHHNHQGRLPPDILYPALMLTVAGAGVALVPMLHPELTELEHLPPPGAGLVYDTGIVVRGGPTLFTDSLIRVTEHSPSKKKDAQADTLDLLSYSVNGIPQQLNGSMDIRPTENDTYEWIADIESYTDFGLPVIYYYTGLLYQENDAWRLLITSSNDQAWEKGFSVPAHVEMRSNYLSMSYDYNGVSVLAEWSSE
ncbi:hypothetical protein O5O45_22435 [Hahella aquimaris]|uniref:hypothetical protein n=1 Tax=Hahella sp. HNIBRBA332 TaxID=3015983 RepID=UPI00273AB70C|nr:hypothetical protein [Hahella sp. HNIBRBA332]WLQ12489.1 hypothetical protein O5O45_22435 [Hahella sp. HNIBRBA332]